MSTRHPQIERKSLEVCLQKQAAMRPRGRGHGLCGRRSGGHCHQCSDGNVARRHVGLAGWRRPGGTGSYGATAAINPLSPAERRHEKCPAQSSGALLLCVRQIKRGRSPR